MHHHTPPSVVFYMTFLSAVISLRRLQCHTSRPWLIRRLRDLLRFVSSSPSRIQSRPHLISYTSSFLHWIDRFRHTFRPWARRGYIRRKVFQVIRRSGGPPSATCPLYFRVIYEASQSPIDVDTRVRTSRTSSTGRDTVHDPGPY